MIPVLRPKLPPAERLAPYLAAIDEARFYSNFGPQVHAFEERLVAHFGLGNGTVTTVANATLGLTLALTAQEAKPGALCMLPGWTFVASANAAVLAGLTPYFVDVDPFTWALDPVATEREILRAPAAVGAVVVVAPFGLPIDYAAWDAFKERTRLPVVIDAAAAFDTVRVGDTPAVVSLHATKIFGIGEGGFVASRDPALINKVRQRSNFGFDPKRRVVAVGFNAKLSEYHAAIGLAALDMWSETRADWLSVANCYRRALRKTDCAALQSGFGEKWVSSTCVVSVDRNARDRILQVLAAAGIDTRLWWGGGAHAEPANAAFPRALLPITENLARSTLGLPIYQDLHKHEIDHIVTTLIAAASS